MENTKIAYSSQILADKLRDLKASQESIETLSEWCVNCRRNAKQIVEAWKKHLGSSAMGQHISLLYLANHILQSSRRNGPEFINEFWKVLPKALRKVYDDGEDEGRKNVIRLVNIWKDRKVFGSLSYILGEEALTWEAKRNQNMNSYELNQPRGEQLEKMMMSYKNFYGFQIDMETISKKYKGALEIVKLGDIHEEFKKQESVVVLRKYTEIFKEFKMRKASLLTNLTEALSEIQGIHDEWLDKLVEEFESLQLGAKSQIIHSSNIDILPKKKKRSRELSPDALHGSYSRKVKNACRIHVHDKALSHASPASLPMLQPPLPPFPPPMAPPPPPSPSPTSPSRPTPLPILSQPTLPQILSSFPPPIPQQPTSPPPTSSSHPPILPLPPSLLTSPRLSLPPQPPTAPSFTPLGRLTVGYPLGHGPAQPAQLPYPSYGIHLGLPLQGTFIQYPLSQEFSNFDPLAHWMHPPT